MESEDKRLDFIRDVVLRGYCQLRLDDWRELTAAEDNRAIFTNFFDNTDYQRLTVSLDPSSKLVVQLDFFQNSKEKVIYFIRRENKVITSDSIGCLLIGEAAGDPVDAIINVTNEIAYTLLDSKAAQGWPKVLADDVFRHTKKLRNEVAIFEGQLQGQTFLPLPARDRNPDTDDESWADSQVDPMLMHAFETLIIDWTQQISDVLKEDSASPLLEGLRPLPSTEFDFWKNRLVNLEGLHAQLLNPKVRKMSRIMMKNTSVYWPTLNNIYNDVNEALREARDVVLYLKPIQKILDAVGQMEYAHVKNHIRAVMHTVSLTWANSEYYCRPARIIVIFQEICNLFIDMTKTFIGPEKVMKGLTEKNDDIQANIRISIQTIETLKESYQSCKTEMGRLFKNGNSKNWDFPSHLVFSRLDTFLERLTNIEEIFSVSAQMFKLGNVAIQGGRGGALEISTIYEEFCDHVTLFAECKYDVFDTDDKKFEENKKLFLDKMIDFEGRLGTVLCKAFDECPSPESAVKLLVMFSFILDRPLVRAQLMPKYKELNSILSAELDNVKLVFDAHIATTGAEISTPLFGKNMPAVAGQLKWSLELAERIQTTLQGFTAIPQLYTHRAEAELVQKCDEMTGLLHQYQVALYSEWTSRVDKDCQFNLKQPLVLRNKGNILTVNFNSQLVAVLREVKYLSIQGQQEIPPCAADMFAQGEVFRKYVCNLDLLVSWYNEIRGTVLPAEFLLIEGELKSIDMELAKAETTMFWNGKGVWEYIQQISHMMHDLYRRVNQAKANVASMRIIMEEWCLKPMFERKDNKKDSLLDLGGRPAVLNKRYAAIRDSGQKLCTLLEENKTLFRANDTMESWIRYVDYIDDKVLEGFIEVVLVSLRFLASSMHATSEEAPLFVFALTLDDRKISLSPSLDYGFIEMVDNLITDVYHAADLIPRLSLTNTTSYQYELEEIPELSEVYEDVMNEVREAVKEAQQFSDSWLHYDFLWVEDRDELMAQFLGKENDFEPEPRTPPTLEEFKNEIDTYENLYSEVSQLENSTLILCWLQINICPFKHSLLNTIKLWSLMFKQCLIDRVTNSLQDQERFNKEVTVGLTETLLEGDYQGLIEVMGHLMRVKESQASIESMFQPLKETVELLKDYGVELPDEVHAKLEDLPQQWNNVKRTSSQAKQNVALLQAHEASVIHTRCQTFETKLEQFFERFRQQPLFDFTCVNPYEALNEAQIEIESMGEELTELKRFAGLFEVNVPDYKLLKACCKEISLLKELWDMISLVNRNLGEWKTTLWKNIDVENMRMHITKYAQDIQVLDKEMRAWDAYSGLESLINNQLTSLRTVVDLQNPALRNRHWLQLMVAAKVRFEMSEKTTFEDLLQLNLHNFEEEVRDIVDKAVKESALEATLATLDSTWSKMALKPLPHSATGTVLLGPNVELVQTLEDSLVQLQTLMASKYIYHVLEEISCWQQKLSTVDLVLSAWFALQHTYASLESIFIFSEDLCSQLPENCKNFDRIARDFKEMILEAVEMPNIIEVTSREGLLEKLKCLEEGLGMCERALAEYLETKRLAFPRFYFVSNNDLLDILSHGQNPIKVNTHLSKLFDSLYNLKFDLDHGGEPATKTACGMFSIEKEYVVFDKRCECSGQVEQWLDNVQERMVNTLRENLVDAIVAYEEKPKDQWLFDYPAQVSVVSTQIWWATEVNIALTRLEDGKENALKDYFKKQVSQLNMLIELLIKEHSEGDRQKLMTICTMDVHARDVVGKLISNKVDNVKAFMWLSQLRHHLEANSKHCSAKLCDAEFRYSYEYLGNTPRLVITPLTDRCYITLTQSLHHVMGGAPSGPACTGKTETIKDLGKALGIMVYVCNCSDQMDYKSLGDIYKGLAQTGAWGCFDQFERISVEVLSVIAMQVKCVQDGIRDKKSTINFLGQIIKLVPTFGAFITMNPGYSGRAELPENLKALFRPCAMVVPDFELICQIMLVAEGFTNAQILAKTFISLYTLCKQLLSRQEHYDWGLRAIKSVLVVAGSLKRGDPSRPEDEVLMRALRDFNLPMIVVDDMPVFMELIEDLFPALDVPRKRDRHFEEVVKQSVLDLKLQAEDHFVLKVAQLEELLAVRHSVFILGDAGTGKSMVIRSLIKTYQNMERNPMVVDLDPKAVTCDELFGVIHPVTREWKDGLLSFLMRNMANASHDDAKWIILDGDIDPMWTECLNSVMDNNKVLTLASNERIPLSPTMRLMFELKDLRMATPATMSRAGILFINPSDLGWNALVTSWMDKREVKSEKANLSIMFDKYLPTCLEKLKTSFKKMTAIPEVALVETLLYIMEGLLVPENTPPDSPKELYELYLVFACVWAFGGAMSQDQLTDYRVEFSKWWLNEFKKVKFPSAGTVFDYYIDSNTKKFVPWTEKLPKFVLHSEPQLQTTLVHTTETIRLSYFMDMLIDNKRPLMLVGNAATGKSVLMGEILRTLSTDQYMIQSIPFNYCTTSAMLQATLEKNLTKKAGKSYGPLGSKRLIYFIEDLNLPEVDQYLTVSPHALIRQHLDQGHWYDRTKLTLKEINNCQYVACMNPTAGSFTIDPRLQRHFVVFGVSYPGQNALKTIYNSILSQYWERSGFTSTVKKLCPTLVNAALMFHQKMSSSFLPTAVKFHYIFNMRDLSNVFQGLLYTGPDGGRSPVEIVHLWLHECHRVYGDKLVGEADIQSFASIQTEICQNCFEDMDQASLLEKPIYCYFSEDARQAEYAPVKNLQSLNNILQEALRRYNEVYGAMSLVFFEDAVAHVCRINRILGSRRRSALLVGAVGTGKRSLTRLAASLSCLEVFQIPTRRGYGVTDLKTDLAALCVKAGVKNVGSVFLMADDQAMKDQFLAPISDLLVSGEIQGLFHDDEVENVIRAMQHEVRQAGLPDSRESRWKLFNDRVTDRIKVIFCFSPLGSTLRVRARKFPALLNCTSIDWFHEWSEKALVSISTHFLWKTEGIEPQIGSVGQFMAYVHKTVIEKSKSYLLSDRRHNYATPKTFLEHIKLYQKLLGLKRHQLQYKMEHLKTGLNKLMNTSSEIDCVKEKLEFQMEELQKKRDTVETLRDAIGQETEKLSKEQAIADEEEIKLNAIAKIIEEGPLPYKDSLAEAEAAQLAAKEDLNHLNKNNLTELKSMGSPPVAVVNVMVAVMILLAPGGKIPKDMSWKAARNSMAKVDVFLKSLINCNVQKLPASCINAAQPFTEEATFEPDSISALSTAAAALCSWCLNVMKLYGAKCDVETKKRDLAQASTTLASSQRKLSVITAKIKQLNSKMAELKEEFVEATNEKLKCQQEADGTNQAISLAGRLAVSLASERVRWSETVAQLQNQEKTLTGDVLLAASFVSYLGYFTKKYRTDLIDNHWLPYLKELKVSIPITEDLDPLTLLTDDAEIAAWSNQGLLNDRMFIENVAILCNTERWPLIVDSQLQSIKWITNKFGNNLKVIRLEQKGFMNTIENAVSNGNMLLIEDISETVEPMLDSLLRRKTTKNGKYIQIGDKEIEYHPYFRLILHTKRLNPHFKPEIQAHCALINFLFTHESVEEQLLAAAVAKERPDLEKNKVDLTTQQNNSKISLSQLEESLLTCLSSDSGNFLRDDGLVENLETLKSTATQIKDKVKESETAEKEINEAREHYRPAAVRATLLYFILSDLNKINPIYQFSLKAFGNVFDAAIMHTKPAKDVEQRVSNLIDQITYSVFLYTSRSLFEQDRLTFVSQMAFQILLLEKEINPKELDFLLRFPFKAELDSPVEFLSTRCWGGIKALSEMDDFENLDQDIEYSARAWRKFVATGSPEKEKFPQEWKKRAGLQKLCMLRCLRPDRMYYAVRDFVEEQLGTKYVERTKLELVSAYRESSPSTTVLFVLSPGVDPVADVEALGKELGFTSANGKLHNFSLGQGQETLAEAALDLAAKEGHWVMLQNIHLVHNWLGCLDKHIEKNSIGSHQDYRVFMSAEPAACAESHVIPQGLLENAIKITNEAPSGVQENLHKALNLFSQETLDMCSMDSEFKRILFALCYFHAVVTERRKFGVQGWNMTYPFSDTDLTISVNVLYNYLEANSKVLWKDLQYLFGEIVYGGHIMDDWDRKLCRTYLEEYLRPELLEGTLALAPGFTAPPNLDHTSYHSYVKNLPAESPHLYGLHPNAEIDFLSVTSDRLFSSILELKANDCGTATGDRESREDNMKTRLDDILEELPQGFNMAAITSKVEARTPYTTVAIQECQRMNILLKEISRSLQELNLGLKGGLTITKDMEELSIALCSDSVPASWTKLAYPSLQGLAGWYADLLLRYKEMETWTVDMAFPVAVWLPGLFSPQSFLTAVMQFVARKNKWPLNSMRLSVEVIKKSREELSGPPREGAYVYGLFMEGARWDLQKGVMAEPRLKEITPSVPVLYVRALPSERCGAADDVYDCPVYRTRARGPTYVWTFPLRSKERPAKWVLATACLLLSK